jgi:hypothetical protein
MSGRLLMIASTPSDARNATSAGEEGSFDLAFAADRRLPARLIEGGLDFGFSGDHRSGIPLAQSGASWADNRLPTYVASGASTNLHEDCSSGTAEFELSDSSETA